MPSYSPVFSQGFLYYTEATPNTSFDVPDGYTAVIREFDAFAGLAAVACSFSVQLSSLAPYIAIATIYVAGIAESAQWRGRVVVPGGGIINISQATLGVDCYMYLGGYLLRNTLS